MSDNGTKRKQKQNGSKEPPKKKAKPSNTTVAKSPSSISAGTASKKVSPVKKAKQNKMNGTTVKSPKPDATGNKKSKWINKQRTLVFSSRGISYRTRHLMQDLRTLMPHAKAEPKMDRKDKLHVINEICEMKNCNKCLYFEGKKKQDVYLWASNIPKGPSAKFLVENVHTTSELKLTGNCLKGSRPLLSFDKAFDSEPHWMLLKELFIQIFGCPNHHPKSQPFTDKVFTFSIQDNRVWFRNYQIVLEDGSLAEIGPRFVLNPIRIFAGSFGGATLYQNPHYISPNDLRREVRRSKSDKYNRRVEARMALKMRKPDMTYDLDPTDQVFHTITPDDVKR